LRIRLYQGRRPPPLVVDALKRIGLRSTAPRAVQAAGGKEVCVTAKRTSMRSRLARRVAVGGLAGMLALVGFTGPAMAQDTSTDEQTVVKVDPGVVFVGTSVEVSVRLTYQDDTQLSGRSSLSERYRFDYGSGSGFVVNPNGVIVTASHVVDPDPDDIRNYAANRLLVRLDKDDDPFARYTLSDSVWNGLLQQCYQRVTCTFETRRTVKVYTPVQIAGVSAPKPLAARVLKSTGFGQTDVAILQVDTSNMPTVPLATTANDLKSGQSIAALGFPGSAQDLPTGFTEPAKLFGRVSNVRQDGASKLVEASITGMAKGMSGGPGVDSQGKVVGLISYSRLDGDTRAQVYLRTVDDIRAALRGAGGAQATRGEVDNLFEQAMEYFWDRHYSAALPLYQKTLNLYDGHPAAKKYLSEAQAKAGGPEDLPLPATTQAAESSWLRLGLAALAAAVLVAAGVALLLRRRRRRRGVPAIRQLQRPGVEVSWDDAGAPRAAANGQPLSRSPVETDDAGHDEAAASGPWADVGAAPVATRTAVAQDVPEPGRPAVRFCSRCGNELGADDSFCAACGHRVR
jgi:serine protease Do